jgi:hypothetical protein
MAGALRAVSIAACSSDVSIWLAKLSASATARSKSETERCCRRGASSLLYPTALCKLGVEEYFLKAIFRLASFTSSAN